MKIIIIRNTVANGRPVEVGDMPEVSKREAHILISMGKAAIAPPEQPVFEAAVAPPVEVAVRPNPVRKARKPRARKVKK